MPRGLWALLLDSPHHCRPSRVGLPGLKQRGDHTCRTLLWACFISPTVHYGNVVTCKEAGKPPLTFSCLPLSLGTKPSKVWSAAQCEFLFPAQRQPREFSPKSWGFRLDHPLRWPRWEAALGWAFVSLVPPPHPAPELSGALRSFFVHFTRCSHVLLFSLDVFPWPLSLLSSQEVIPE